MPELNIKNLNPEQKKAVVHDKGPLLIVAGAGTGKTTVITQRIGWLIEQEKAKADEILALTFTEKAAAEMEERVDRLLPYGYVDLWISTFHAFAEKILQQHAIEIGIPNDFKMLNQTEQWMLIRQNLDKFGLDFYQPLGNPTKFIQALIKLFSRAKDEVISPQDYLAYAKDLQLNADGADFIKNFLDPEEIKTLSKKEKKELVAQEIKKVQEIANAYHIYQQLLLENNALDFGDLINYCLKLFRERPAILARYRNKFKYILVDEFQDTNYAQYELVKLLAQPNQNVTVVGDDDQCLPPDSLIETEDGKKKIRDIKVGDRVATAVGRGYFSYSRVNKVFKNSKKARLINFKTAKGYKVRVTDNHKMFCFVPAVDDKKYYYVYLMHRKNLGWRLGVTNDLALRLRLERSADRILGVKTCLSEIEARFYETLYSLKYNIPTVCFKARDGTAIKDEWMFKLYQQIDTERNVKKLAADLNLDLSAHHHCLVAVNRGGQLRIKINLEMCHRRYRSKFARANYLVSPKVVHLLSLETSHAPTIKKISQAGFKFESAKKGYRLRLYSSDLKKLGETALKLEKLTGGIAEVSAKLGPENIQTRKTLVMSAKNVLVGQYLPILTKQGVIYDRVIGKVAEKEKSEIVYDLEVENTHNFVADGVVVHNSIYKFRGASVSNILEFKRDYKTAAEIFLTKNYRSTQNILDLSYKFIQQNNPNRLEVKLAENRQQTTDNRQRKLTKQLISQIKADGEIKHFHFETVDDEIRGVLKQLARLKDKDQEVSWSDFAILARTNEVANLFSQALSQTKIPYRFVASRGLYLKPVVLDVLAYLRLLDDYHESSAVYRILNSPVVGLSDRTIVQLNYWARRKGYSLFVTLQQPEVLRQADSETKAKIQKFLGLVERHTQLAREKSVAEVVMAFLEDSGYLQQLTQEENIEMLQTTSYLNQFYKRITDFEQSSQDGSVKTFLELINLELEAGQSGDLEQNLDEGPDAVKVMTIHAAKGLEFKYVWVVNMVDRRFPTDDRPDPISLPDKLIKEILPAGDVHLQEERRLFYVAMTRAKTGVFFTSAVDYGGARQKKLSRFLAELSDLGFKLDQTEIPTAAGKLKLGAAAGAMAVSQIAVDDLNYLLPKKFSFTQLNSFLHCPYHYWLEYILKIPQRGKNFFSFGSSIHTTLQQFFLLVKERHSAGQQDLFGVSKSKTKKQPLVSLDELLSIYERYWIDDWYTSRSEHDNYKANGRRMLKDFYQEYQINPVIPKFLETPFNLHLSDEDTAAHYTIIGKIDRIDQINNGVELIDYKTGASRSAKSLAAEDKQQLLIYQLAATRHLGERVEKLTYYYLEDGNRVSFIGLVKDLDHLQQKMIKTIKDILNYSWPAKKSDCTCHENNLSNL